MNAVKNKIAALADGSETSVTLVGTRFGETAERKKNMTNRQETWDRPWKNSDGFMMMSPLALWTTGHVFEFMNKASSMPFPVFCDFINTILLYEAMGEETCDINKLVDGSNGKGVGCGDGSRAGCWTCMRVSEDKSLGSLAKFENPEFKPLVMFRNLMKAGHYVIENRCWVGRKFDKSGRVNVAGNTYSREWQRTLLRIAITLEFDEQTWAMKNDKQLRFEVMPVEDIVMIAFMWERYGLHNWSDAIEIYQDVVENGNGLHPTQEMIDEQYAKNVDSNLFGDQDATLKLGDLDSLKQTYEDTLAQFSNVEKHESRYQKKGAKSAPTHSPLSVSISGPIEVDLGDEPEMGWWWINEQVSEMKSRGTPIDRNFLYRNGYVAMPAGYQSKLGNFQWFGARMRANDMHLYAHSPELLRKMEIWEDNNPQQPLF